MKLVDLTKICLNEFYNEIHVGLGKHLCNSFVFNLS
jgi:hypothetical protein